MLNWQQVLDFANQSNPKPDREVTRSDEEWRTLLDEQHAPTWHRESLF